MALTDKILQLLENGRGRALSGQQIADALGVTRASVWKAVKSLQGEGYQIAATTNKGYILQDSNDILSEQSLRAALKPKYSEIDIVALKSCSSTNTEAMTRLMCGQLSHGALVVADEQTSGRGRIGKTFFSPQKGLYMSVALCKSIQNISDVTVITPAAAVATRNAIEQLTGIDAAIKWVNDLYIGKKKLCGILTQADIDFESGKAGNFIVGIGVNFVEQNFPDEIKDKAVALFEGQPTVTRSMLIAEIYDNLLTLTDDLQNRDFMSDYKAHSLVVGKEISYEIDRQKKSGKVLDIDSDGGLIVQEGYTIRKLTCGEISIRSENNEWI